MFQHIFEPMNQETINEILRNSFKWIKVRPYKEELLDYPDTDWKQAYIELLKHHKEETTFLIDTIRDMASFVIDGGEVKDKYAKLHGEVLSLEESEKVLQEAMSTHGVIKSALTNTEPNKTKLELLFNLHNDIFSGGYMLCSLIPLAGVKTFDTTDSKGEKHKMSYNPSLPILFLEKQSE